MSLNIENIFKNQIIAGVPQKSLWVLNQLKWRPNVGYKRLQPKRS